MKLKAAGYGLLTVALVAGLTLPTRPVLGHGGGVLPEGPPLRPRSAAQLPNPGSFVNYETPHVHPLDINAAGTFVAACNTPDGFVEIYSVDGVTGDLTHVDSIRVGYAPVSARFRTNDELWVVNHLSDTVSVLSIAGGDVVRTIQTFDGYNGTHAGDEPADVVFTSTGHALVSGSRSDVIQRYTASTGAYVDEFRLDGEDPRMLATNAAGTSAYAAIFESGNGSTVIQGAPVQNGGFPGPLAMQDTTNPYSGVNPPFNNGIPGSAWIVDGVSVGLGDLANTPPEVPLIVKKDAGGAWRDDNGADWTPWITGAKAFKSGRFTGWDLLDNDVAILTSAGSFTSATYATRQMNHVMAVAVDPATGEVFSVGTDAINELRFEPNVNSIFVRVMLAITNAAGAPQHLVDLNEQHLAFVQGGTAYSTRNVPQGDRDDSIGDPRGIAFKPGSGVVYITGMGSNNLVVVNTVDGSRLGTNGEYTIEVGRGPTGIVHHPTLSRLYVLNKFDASITTVGTGTVGAEIIRQTLPFFDPTPAFINTGRVHLYSTHDSSGLGQAACGSCHIDARMDRMAWDLGNPAGGSPQGVEHIIDTANILNGTAGVSNFFLFPPGPNGVAIHTMKGPMTTQTLQDIIGHEPFHWRGDRDGVEEFSGAFQGLQGDDVPLPSIPMQDFEDFLSTIHFPPNPFRALDNSLPGGPALVGAGTNPSLPLPGHVSPGMTPGKFYSAPGTPLPAGNAWQGFINYIDPFMDGPFKCVQCHALPLGSGPATTAGGTVIPPGPLGQAHIGMVTVDGTGQPHIKVPQTRNQFDKEGFFLNQAGPGTVDASLNPSRAGFGLVHDGTVDGLTRFLGEPVFSTPTDQSLADIVAFALCINGDGFSDLFALPGGPVGSSLNGGVTQAAHAAVGHQVTTTSGSPPAGDQATIDLLVTLASQDKIGLIVSGVVGGNRANWRHASGTGAGALFQRDENSSAKQTLSTVQSFATAGDPLTFMAVPKVSEIRMGVDRDEDGSFNRTEILNGTDPADPASFIAALPVGEGMWFMVLLGALAFVAAGCVKRGRFTTNR